MCIADLTLDQPRAAAPESGNAIQRAINLALAQHRSLSSVLQEELDPTSIAINCAEAASHCRPDQIAIAARLLLAAESIRRLVHP